jgi:hypothetical protein
VTSSREEFTGLNTDPVMEKCAARSKEGCLRVKILEAEEQRERNRRPTCNPDTRGTQLQLWRLTSGPPVKKFGMDLPAIYEQLTK